MSSVLKRLREVAEMREIGETDRGTYRDLKELRERGKANVKKALEARARLGTAQSPRYADEYKSRLRRALEAFVGDFSLKSVRRAARIMKGDEQ